MTEKITFQTIGIIAKGQDSATTESLAQLIEFLKSKKLTLRIEENSIANLPHPPKESYSTDTFTDSCDLIIVVGGDGSLLAASHALTDRDIPLLGINRGSLGFLTDILPETLETQVGEVLQGKYTTESRFLLKSSVTSGQNIIETGYALNEVALLRDSIPHMVRFDIYIDDTFVCHERADGLITATPTGSTAYSLSGGGPIVHPGLNAISLLPMFSHTLSARPLVIDADSVIKVIFTEDNTTSLWMTCDNQCCVNVAPGSTIEIKKNSKTLLLLHPLSYDYFDSLRTKLHWGQKPQARGS
jgi:NAD+ kinase